MLKEKKSDKQTFRFKQFELKQDQCAMKIGTDGVLLGAWADAAGVDRILDIGTGTGLIAIMMAQRNVDANIHAVEIEEAAFDQAKKNMEESPWKDRLEVFHTSIQDFARSSRTKYDLIISNPPFFSGGTFSQDQDRNNVRHTVKLPNGDLLSATRSLLSQEGRFCVILPYIEGLRFKQMAERYHLFCTKMVEVKPKKEKGVERLLLQFERTQRPLEESELIIQREKRNDYTDDYVDLTKEFYLKM